MTESPEPEVVPPGLRKRWEEFGELSRKCWAKVKPKELPTAKAFEEFFSCMRTGDPVSRAEVEGCARIGHPLAPAPICVLVKTAKDIPPAQAVKECLDEGKVHGISLLACRAAKVGEI